MSLVLNMRSTLCQYEILRLKNIRIKNCIETINKKFQTVGWIGDQIVEMYVNTN